MKKLRIALVAPQPFVDLRGTPMANLRLAQVLADNGYTVDVFTYPFGSDPDYPGIRVRRCGKAPWVRAVGVGFSPAKCIQDVSLAAHAFRLGGREYDCFHGVEEGAFIAAALARRHRRPLVYDMDSVMSHEVACSPLRKLPGAVRLMSMAERWVIRQSELVMTISDSMAEYARRMAPSKRVAVVPDVPIRMQPGGPDAGRALALLPADTIAGRKIVMYTGSFASYQGLDLLVGAMTHVVKRIPHALLIIVGGSDREISTLTETARANSVLDNLVFLGKRPSETIPDLLSLSDALVSPRRGGINPPAKIYTYMQSGRPSVITNIPAHTTVLGPDAATIVDTTLDSIAEGIIDVLEHPIEAEARAERAQAIVSTITPELQAARILEGYQYIEEICRASSPCAR